MARTPADNAAPQSFVQCFTHFLTPQVWKQARQAVPPRHASRWHTPPLVWVLLTMTWCSGDSQPERFETARAFYVACHPRRRRPGRTFAGFERALGKLPLPVLRAVAAGVRGRLTQVFAARWLVDGFVPLGCDGSRLACPRSEELERRLGLGRKKKRRRKKKPVLAAPPDDRGPSPAPRKPPAGERTPQVWLTAILHLGLGVPWSWRWGGGSADEREHLRHLAGDLPRHTLLVADAGYVGYELLTELQTAGHAFLVRLSSRAPLYVEDKSTLRHYREGEVYYWPVWVQKEDRPPLTVRLLRIEGDKADVWLITNVLDVGRLPKAKAAKFYRWRWRSEGLFRSYKRTLGKVKLMGRTVAQVHREAEGSMLATQLLLAQGALALPGRPGAVSILPSPRKVLLEIRGEIRNVVGMYLGPRQQKTYRRRLEEARWGRRRQTSAKVRRRWPGRADHKPPGKPTILKMGTLLKDKLEQILRLAKLASCI
jgi:hypothetical protein